MHRSDSRSQLDSVQYEFRLLQFLTRARPTTTLGQQLLFDGQGHVLRITNFHLGGTEATTPLLDGQALLRALISQGNYPDEFAGRLFLWRDTTPEQVTRAFWDPHQPWQLHGQREVIHFEPGELQPKPIDRAIAALLEMGFVGGESLYRLVKPCPEIAVPGLRWFLRHPWVITRSGREALRMVFSGAVHRLTVGDYKADVLSGLHKIFFYNDRPPNRPMPDDITVNGDVLIKFCKLMRRAVRSGCLKPVLGYGHTDKPPPPQQQED